MTHMSYPAQNGVTYAKPHINNIRLKSFSLLGNGTLNLSLSNQLISAS